MSQAIPAGRMSSRLSDRLLHSVVVAHPELQHSHQLAAALHGAGLLGCYFHGAALPANIEAEIPSERRRRVRWFQPLRRALPYTLPRTMAASVFTAMLQHYDRLLARRLGHLGVAAVVAYEVSAVHTFQAAKRAGMACILDAASVHHTMQSAWIPSSNDEWTASNKDHTLALADLVLTCSTLARDSYVAAGIPAAKVRTLPLGVDTIAFANRQPASQACEHEALRFCFAGRVNRLKGADLLAAACRNIYASGKDFTLSIAGSQVGSEPALLSQFEEFADLCGRIRHADLPNFYRQADVLVLPSRFDSFGLTVAEALACGLPAIVTENVGAKDIITEGVNGWIIPAGDENALTERMAWCATNPRAVRAMSAAARASAEAHDWHAYRGKAVAAVRTFLDEWTLRNARCRMTAARPTADGF
jgi:glycosyltransferase involved in cell wall biosynthesis